MKINTLPYIFHIQKFSIHDGPGIRTTVFFKGCPMRCAWCHNPESQSFEPEWMEDSAEERIGFRYSVGELIKILKKDQIFYDQSGGGVTLSGGEVMAQNMDYVEELVRGLKREGITVCVDTCGLAPAGNFTKILPWVDLFLYDVKIFEDEKHKQYTGVSNKRILENLKLLSDAGANIELRMIMMKDVNMEDGAIERTAEWLKKENIRLSRVTLLPYHDFGRDKYRKLHRECTQNFEKPGEEDLERVKKILEKYGYETGIR